MSQQTKTAAQAAAKKRPGSDQEAMPFQRKNYRLLILGSLLLILGYALLQAPSHFVDARESVSYTHLTLPTTERV